MHGLALPEIITLVLALAVMLLFLGIPAVRICRRTGNPPWLGLLIVVPLVNIGLLYYIAFSKWEEPVR